MERPHDSWVPVGACGRSSSVGSAARLWAAGVRVAAPPPPQPPSGPGAPVRETSCQPSRPSQVGTRLLPCVHTGFLPSVRPSVRRPTLGMGAMRQFRIFKGNSGRRPLRAGCFLLACAHHQPRPPRGVDVAGWLIFSVKRPELQQCLHIVYLLSWRLSTFSRHTWG